MMTGHQEEERPDENEIEMLVSCRPLAQALPNGQSIGCDDGDKLIRVLTSHERQVMDMLETEPGRIDEAKVHYQRNLDLFLAKTVTDGDVTNATPEEREKAAATYEGSVQASFHEITGRDIKPLIKAEVTRRDLPPKAREKAVKENELLVKGVVEGIAQTLGSRDEKMLEMVGDVVARVTDKVLNAPTPNKGKRG